MPLGLCLLEVVGVASLLVSLSLLVLHLLLVQRPSLQLLGTPLLGRPQPLQTGHFVQLLQLLDQLQVVGHTATRGGRGTAVVDGWWRGEVEGGKSMFLARAAPSAVASSHHRHHHPFSSSKRPEETERERETVHKDISH